MEDELQLLLAKLSDYEKELLRTYFLNQNVHSKVRSQFTKEEDAKLIQLVQKYTANNFNAIAKELPGRSVRQCRERWKHYLSPSVRNTPWTEDEDNLLRMKYYELGPKWVEISSYFQNRTDVNIKNRWIVLMRKDSKNILSVSHAKRSPPTVVGEIHHDIAFDSIDFTYDNSQMSFDSNFEPQQLSIEENFL